MTKSRAGLLLILLLGALLVPVPAKAHSELESSRPAEGTTVKKAPDHIVLNFSESPAKDSIVTVSDPCTKDLVGDSFVAGNQFHVQLGGGTGGKYEVRYALISAEDGHATKGTFSFSVKGRADCKGSQPADPDDAAGDDGSSGSDDAAAPDTDPVGDEDGSSSPMIPIALGGLGLVAIAALARFATRR